MAAPVVFTSLSDMDAHTVAQLFAAKFNELFSSFKATASNPSRWSSAITVEIKSDYGAAPTHGGSKIEDKITVNKGSISIPKNLYDWMVGNNADATEALKKYLLDSSMFPGAAVKMAGGYRHMRHMRKWKKSKSRKQRRATRRRRTTRKH